MEELKVKEMGFLNSGMIYESLVDYRFFILVI